MHEMFEKIKKIIIPKEVIPDDLYQQFLIQYNTENQKLERKLYNWRYGYLKEQYNNIFLFSQRKTRIME